ncbi:MAG: cytochrome d ubiquinol oxidase subunit II [Candidatus Micrarchaeota archaeon]|nr:cytochrome d ubiquinol oxidase subunit II [Candidatus Micrarchaeota archaeon]
MNPLYIANYLIFSVFFTLLIMEIGAALLALVAYSNYREKLRRYLLPIWEVNGTFAAFYLVNFEATYPTLLGLAGTIYVLPLLLAGAAFILRSVFLVYAEVIGAGESEQKYMKIYAICTLAMSFFAISVLGSGLSGIGINVAANSADLFTLIFSPLNMLLFLGIILIAGFLSINYFEVGGGLKRGTLAVLVAIAVILFGISQYIPSIFAGIIANIYLPILSLAILAVSLLMQLRKNRYANHLSILWLVLSINLLGVAEYPNIFGSQSILQYLTSSEAALPLLIITTIGSMAVALSLAVLIYVNYIRKEVAY